MKDPKIKDSSLLYIGAGPGLSSWPSPIRLVSAFAHRIEDLVTINRGLQQLDAPDEADRFLHGPEFRPEGSEWVRLSSPRPLQGPSEPDGGSLGFAMPQAPYISQSTRPRALLFHGYLCRHPHILLQQGWHRVYYYGLLQRLSKKIRKTTVAPLSPTKK
ncbi:hypothetical protein FSARC_9163 [Fusarium sarcochroum]|uniref:Uncharacterized protein n=1 Tax=Fusarium sarcochroum TaxID=1208366 RepID=A0A8H4TRG0_9HYPO|nr:hypothetical protein FSARC_9163 [Fusarium sarcochroum]